MRKLDIHDVPKHASWLNEVEIEMGVLEARCFDRRSATRELLVQDLAAWDTAPNASGGRIRWMFSTERAREKLTRVYRTIAHTREKAALEQAA